MKMFEGKEGFRIFKRKKDAELAAEVNSRAEGIELDTQKIKISDEKLAKKQGISVNPDLSIASQKPKKGEIGWIVVKKGEENQEKYKEVLKLLEE